MNRYVPQLGSQVHVGNHSTLAPKGCCKLADWTCLCFRWWNVMDRGRFLSWDVGDDGKIPRIVKKTPSASNSCMFSWIAIGSFPRLPYFWSHWDSIYNFMEICDLNMVFSKSEPSPHHPPARGNGDLAGRSRQSSSHGKLWPNKK